MFFPASEELKIKENILSFSGDMEKYLDSGLSFLESLAAYLLQNHEYGKAYVVLKETVKEQPDSPYAVNSLSKLESLRERIINSPIYGKKYVITGDLFLMDRQTALDLIQFFGGATADSPVNTMDVLVVGYSEWSELNDGKPTRKIVKAQELQAKGRNVQIISDKEFLTDLSKIAKGILPEDTYLYFFENTEYYIP